MPPENPFVFDRPLEDKGDLLQREEQLAELTAAVQAGRDILVEGPPRHGKTSLVNAAFAELVAEHDCLAARVDCTGVLTANDVARRLEDGYARAWAPSGAGETLIERLQALSVEASTPEARVEALLGLPGEIAARAKCRAVVCFDEAQEALAIQSVADALRRQRRAEPSRVFTGAGIHSQESPAWTKRAAIVTVGRIEALWFAGDITERFAATGRDAGETPRVLATLGAGHPQRTKMYAAVLWDMTAEGECAPVWAAHEAIQEAVRRSTPELEARFQALHGNERRVAVAIANGLAPQGTRAQREVGLAGFGAAQRAVRGLESRGVAEMRGERMALTDPLFVEWLRARYPQAPPEPDWSSVRRWRERDLTRGMERGE
jgi:hypothetical protein